MADRKTDNQWRRRSIRLRNYDYAEAGAYYVTLCACGRRTLFGRVGNGVMHRNSLGHLALDCLLAIPDHFPHVEADCFVIMPNHVHMVLVLHGHGTGTACCAPTSTGGRFGSLSAVVRSYKSAVTRQARCRGLASRRAVWQRNYYEHIIRTDRELEEVRRYIAENPIRWSLDRENPDAVEPGDDLPWEL